MSRPQQTVYTLKDVCRMTGVSRHVVGKAITAGRLKAFRTPVRNPKRDKQHHQWYYVQRDELVRWLLAEQFDLRYLRVALNATKDAEVVLVRTRPGIQSAFLRHGPAARATSLFDLGRMIVTRSVWAVVVDLCENGSAEATRSLADLSEKADRPELIGLYDDEYHPRPETAKVFDLLLPLSRSDADLASSVNRLKFRV